MTYNTKKLINALQNQSNQSEFNYSNGTSSVNLNGNGHEINGINVKNSLRSVLPILDLICFSHLRWNFVFQRPQHLLTRWAKEMRVTFIEEPIFGKFGLNELRATTSKESNNITVLTPHIIEGTDEKEINVYLEKSIKEFISKNNIEDYICWYITPMAIKFSIKLNPRMVIYDCMDELSGFLGANPDISKNETELLKLADVVFTGGHNLYEHKKNKHSNIHPLPSSIDQKHFESGKGSIDPADQANISHPRIGFFGVLDERLDLELLDGLAKEMPLTQFVMIGPVVKIDPSTLPKHDNIHYLGQKSYQELPNYLAHWDIAFLPFAKNDSTRFISPTKTPEYLCAGKPVVSTSIHDVVNPYGTMGLVQIADNTYDFSVAINVALNQINDKDWANKVHDFLKTNSWDLTWLRMKKIVFETLAKKESSKKSYAYPSPTLTSKSQSSYPNIL